VAESLQITIQDSEVVHLKPGDPGFMMVDGFAMVSRASIVIDQSCPTRIAETLQWAMQRGWIQPRASVRREEHMWDLLRATDNS
jgi:hypothetical protein